MSNIYEKLRNAQVELKAPKGQYNSHGRYNYRSAEDILEEVKPINQKYGLTLTISDDIVQVADRVYVKAIAVLTDGKETLQVTAFAREVLERKGMDGSQITGASSSYARKYALNGLYLIDDTKDDDTDEQRTETEARAKKELNKTSQTIPNEQTEEERIRSVRKSITRLMQLLLDEYNVSKVDVYSHVEKVTGKPIKMTDPDTALDIIKKLVNTYEAKGK